MKKMKYCGVCGEPWDGKTPHLHGKNLSYFDQTTGRPLGEVIEK